MPIEYSVRAGLVLLDVTGLSPGDEIQLHEFLRLHPELGHIRQPNGGEGHFTGLFSNFGADKVSKHLVQKGAVEKKADLP